MGDLPNWQVYGVPVALMLVAIVNWLKTAHGMESKWAFPVATGLAAVFGALLFLSDAYQWASVVFQIVMTALILGLSASGLYSNTKHYIEEREGE